MDLNCPNISFRKMDDITSQVSMPQNLQNTTVILINVTAIKNEIIDQYADILIKAGCKSFVFYGKDENNWHYRFDLKGLSFLGEADEVILTSTLDSLEELPDEFLISEKNVLIYASDYEMIRKCYKIVVDAGCGTPVKYIGESTMDLKKDEIYRVLSIEKGWYRIMTEYDEDYLFPPELFQEIQ